MFLGGTPTNILAHVLKMIDEHGVSRFFAPFAGNFSLEQMCRSAKDGKYLDVHSTDVSTYSNLLGFGFTDKEHKIRLTDEKMELFDFVEKWTPDEWAVVSMVMSELSVVGSRLHIPYYDGVYKDFMKNKKRYFEKAMAKYLKVKARINEGPFEYYGIDASKVLSTTVAGDMVYYDPPFNTGSYELQFKNFNKCFKGNDVEYSPITPEVVKRQMEWLHERDCIVVYRGQSHFIESGVIKVPDTYKLVHKTVYKQDSAYLLYCNKDEKETRVYNFLKVNEKIINVPFITMEDEITPKSRVKWVRVSNEVLNHYRLMWIKKAFMVGGTGISFLCFINNKLIGGLQTVSGMVYGREYALILSDPVCPLSRYRRLSKLLLALVCSEPFMKINNQEHLWEHSGFITGVYSNNLTSMKYRGLFERKTVEKLAHGNTLYSISYESKVMFRSTKEALNWWLLKHSHVLITDKVREGEEENEFA